MGEQAASWLENVWFPVCDFRGSGHDWCTVRLACQGYVNQIEIDTRYFTGNYAPSVSLEACLSEAARGKMRSVAP